MKGGFKVLVNGRVQRCHKFEVDYDEASVCFDGKDIAEDFDRKAFAAMTVIESDLEKAAPVLLKALKRLCKKYIQNRGTNAEFISCITPKGIPDYWIEAEQAIAQAEGRK